MRRRLGPPTQRPPITQWYITRRRRKHPALAAGSAGTPPFNTVHPVISGSAAVGSTLTTTTGTWTGDATITFDYQWRSGGSSVGRNQNTYVPVTADIGNTITVTVIATDGAGRESQISAATSAVVAASTHGPSVQMEATTDRLVMEDGTSGLLLEA